MLHSYSKQAEKAFCIAFFFFLAFFFLFARALHLVLFMSQMNYGLNARANVLCTTYEKNTGKKRERRRSLRERKGGFFPYNSSRKVETKRRHRREEKESGTSFHLLLLLVSVAYSIGHGHEHRTTGNHCSANHN